MRGESWRQESLEDCSYAELRAG